MVHVPTGCRNTNGGVPSGAGQGRLEGQAGMFDTGALSCDLGDRNPSVSSRTLLRSVIGVEIMVA